MQTAKQSRPWKYLLAGTLAGASGAAGIMIVATIGLSVGLLWQFAYYRNISLLNGRATTALMEDVGRIPAFLWSWRWVLLAMAVSGIPLARLERFAQRYPPPVRDRLAALALLAVVGAVVTSGLLAEVDSSLYTVVTQPQGTGLPGARDMQDSIWYLIMLSVALSLGIGGALWMYWAWWYARWRRWMHLDATGAPQDAPETSSDDWFAARQVRERRQRTILVLLVGSVLFTLVAVSGYEYARTTIQSGDLTVQPTAPAAAVRLAITRPTRALVVENTFGGGTASVTLLSARDRAPVAGPVQLKFEDADLGSQRVPLSVADLPAGEYLLAARVGSGAGGRVGYALLQGNATLVLIASIMVGVGLGAALALVALVVGVLAADRLSSAADRL